MTTIDTKQHKDLISKGSTKTNNLYVFPFTHINAITDTNTGDIFLSSSAIATESASGILCDESSHIKSGSANHDVKWREACILDYGYVPDHNNEFDQIRRRLGIPNNIAANIGNITGIQNILTDYTLLQQYRRFSQRILGNEGHWEWIGDRKIRLYPTPKGAFPVVVLYIPPIDKFRSPQARKLAMDMLLAETMISLGNTRSKFSGIPSPDGSSLSLNGADLLTKGQEMYDNIIELANNLGEPLGMYRY